MQISGLPPVALAFLLVTLDNVVVDVSLVAPKTSEHNQTFYDLALCEDRLDNTCILYL